MKRMKKNALIRTIQLTHGEEIEELLRTYFVDDNMSQHDIARKLNISYLTVVRWLKRAGVRHRRIDLGD
jgi:DNA-binding transcriptional regulator LsrR (DeoR family)